MFSTRALSAVFVVLAAAIAILAGEPWFSLGIAACAVLALNELYRMFGVAGYTPFRFTGLILAVLMVGTATFELSEPLLGLVVTTVVMVLLVQAIFFTSDKKAFVNWALTVGGAFYIGWLLRYVILVRHLGGDGNIIDIITQGILPQGIAWAAVLFCATWLVDTGAYLVGSRFGRHKMTPVLSPKKTWEGAVGGVLFTIITVVALIPLFRLSDNYPMIILLGVVIGVVAQIGDLVESFFKRQVGVKDSGNLIPGHGGMFDRIDSLLFTGAGMYYFVVFFMQVST